LNKAYAFWTLKTDDGKYFTGPEQTIIESGGSAEPIYSGTFNSVEVILGKIYVDLSTVDLSQWDVLTVTSDEAKQFISENFQNEDTRENAPKPTVNLQDLLSKVD
jgi:hypothetical protein